jgi:hypothetical protein
MLTWHRPSARPGVVVAGVAATLACAGPAAPALAQDGPADACPNGWSTEQEVGFASTRRLGPSPSRANS